MSAAAAYFIIATTAAGVGGAEGAVLLVQFSSRRGSFQKICGHEEAKSHNTSAKNDNEECNKECHSQILISFTRAKKVCSGI